MTKLRVSLSMKNKPGVQGDYRATYSVLFLPVSVPISTHTALLTVSTSSLIALFQLPLLFPWFNSLLVVSPQALAVGHDLVSLALSSPLYSNLHSLGQSFVSPQMPCPLSHYILAPFFFLTFCLAPVSFAAFFSSFVSPHSFGLLFASPQFFFCCSSVSYGLAPFFWLHVCLVPVFSSLFSLLQSYLASVVFFLLSFTVSPHFFGSIFISPQFFFFLLFLTVSPHSFGSIFISPHFVFFLLSLTVSPHSFGLIFISSQFFSSSLSCSLVPFFLNICLAPVFPFLLPLEVSPNCFGLIFISPQFFFLFSLSYNLAPFFWLNIYLVSVVFLLFSLLQSRPILSKYLSRPSFSLSSPS